MQELGWLVLWFSIAYILVGFMGVAHTIFNIYALYMKPMDQEGFGEGYRKAKPWNVLYALGVFTLFGYVYLDNMLNPTLVGAVCTGVFWVILCVAVDIFGWFIMKHPCGMTVKKYYTEYHPWVLLTYIAVFLGPIVSYEFIT